METEGRRRETVVVRLEARPPAWPLRKFIADPQIGPTWLDILGTGERNGEPQPGAGDVGRGP